MLLTWFCHLLRFWGFVFIFENVKIFDGLCRKKYCAGEILCRDSCYHSFLVYVHLVSMWNIEHAIIYSNLWWAHSASEKRQIKSLRSKSTPLRPIIGNFSQLLMLVLMEIQHSVLTFQLACGNKKFLTIILHRLVKQILRYLGIP